MQRLCVSLWDLCVNDTGECYWENTLAALTHHQERAFLTELISLSDAKSILN